MEELVGASLARQRFLSVLFGIFAGSALLLACTGIYGVLAYLTGQRISEIGVRIAVGASVRDIMRLVLWQSLKMILAGVSLGIVAAVAAGRELQHLVQGMQTANGAAFAIMIPLLMLAALLASFVPSSPRQHGRPCESFAPGIAQYCALLSLTRKESNLDTPASHIL